MEMINPRAAKTTMTRAIRNSIIAPPSECFKKSSESTAAHGVTEAAILKCGRFPDNGYEREEPVSGHTGIGKNFGLQTERTEAHSPVWR
jgi:hypothetical protein